MCVCVCVGGGGGGGGEGHENYKACGGPHPATHSWLMNQNRWSRISRRRGVMKIAHLGSFPLEYILYTHFEICLHKHCGFRERRIYYYQHGSVVQWYEILK